MVNPGFWENKKVFLTGHTGFKGSWLALWLSSMKAQVVGYALEPDQSPCLFNMLNLQEYLSSSIISDVRDLDRLSYEIDRESPQILIHMAAQPLVRKSYISPVDTYSTNVMGTVNVLEAVRNTKSVKSALIITTDKCYENKEWLWGYRETDPMGGFDPYSSSKGCAELVVQAYQRSYFSGPKKNCGIATARAGNVIGGGDWSVDRLIPDILRALEKRSSIELRYPSAIRPWQHVLEPLSGYLMLAEALYKDPENFSSSWNFGPADSDCRTVENVIDLFINKWGAGCWNASSVDHLHEANFLKLDCSKANKFLKWKPRWHLEESIEKIVEWHKAHILGEDMKQVTLGQIKDYINK